MKEIIVILLTLPDKMDDSDLALSRILRLGLVTGGRAIMNGH